MSIRCGCYDSCKESRRSRGMRQGEWRRGRRASRLSAWPNGVKQGAGVLAQVVWASVKPMRCSHACGVLPAGLHLARGLFVWGYVQMSSPQRPSWPPSPQQPWPPTDPPPFTFWLFSLWWCVFFLPDTYYCLIYCYVVTSFLSVSLLFEGKDFVLSTAPSPKMGINRHIVGNGYISAEWMYEWMDTARNQVRRNYIRLITARWNELPWLMFLLCRW